MAIVGWMTLTLGAILWGIGTYQGYAGEGLGGNLGTAAILAQAGGYLFFFGTVVYAAGMIRNAILGINFDGSRRVDK